MRFCESKISDENAKNMFMTQISKHNETHDAIFPENYFVVDDIFLQKKEHCAACSIGWVIINEIVCGKMASWGFVPLAINVTFF